MRTLRVFVSCAAVGLMAFSAAAQQQDQPGSNPPRHSGGGGGDQERPRGQGRGMMGLPPEKAKAAWELEARTVAKQVKANDEQTNAVVKAYQEARESHTKAMDKLRQDMMEKARKEREQGGNEGEGGGRRGGGMFGPEMQKAMDDLNTSERSKLEKALNQTLKPEQTSKAIEVLGSFNPQWDRAVDAIAGLKLDPSKQDQALKTTEDYVISLNKARNAEPDERRSQMRDAHDKLMESLKKVLTDDQVEQVQAALNPGGRMRGPGGGGGRNDPNRGG